MSATMSPDEFRFLCRYIEAECGLSLGREKMYLVQGRLGQIMKDSGVSNFRELVAILNKGRTEDLRQQVIDAITTQETLWFRDTDPWLAVRDNFLGLFLAEASRTNRKVRIWSAASSTGQEAYSTAMLILDFCGRNKSDPSNFEIVATDISHGALAVARAASYDSVSMNRGLLKSFSGYRGRFFRPAGRQSIVCDEARSLVTFREQNLMKGIGSLGRFDLIMVRNVAIYFSESLRKGLFLRVHGALRKNGALLLGNGETLIGTSDRFVPHDITSFYVKRRGNHLQHRTS